MIKNNKKKKNILSDSESDFSSSDENSQISVINEGNLSDNQDDIESNEDDNVEDGNNDDNNDVGDGDNEDGDNEDDDNEDSDDIDKTDEEENNIDDENCLYKKAKLKKHNDEYDDEDENNDNDEIDLDIIYDDDDNINNNNKHDIFVDAKNRITKPFITQYEYVRILGDRAKALSLGAKPMIKNADKLNCKEIAKLEIKKGIIPLIIIRELPNGLKEKWKVHEFKNYKDM